MDSKNSYRKNPLVSICTTFFNADRYIHRLIESCLNQTYKNIELVIVDDASNDTSERIIHKYTTQDPRIVYYKNNERIGLAESELNMFQLAKGEFSMMVGADDWLARDYIENGTRTLLEHTDIAGVVPQLLCLAESHDGTFTVKDNRFYTFFPPKKYSAEWFIQRLYKPEQLYASAFALVRNKDYIRAMEYYLKRYYRNLPEFASDELRHFFKMAFGMDIVVFPEILTRYKAFVFDSSMLYIKVSLPDGQQNNLNIEYQSMDKIFKEAWYQSYVLKIIYKEKWSRFYKKMIIFKGADVLSTALIYFFRNKFRFSFLNIKNSKKNVRIFFNELSFIETIIATIYSVPMFAFRFFSFIKMKLIKKSNYNKKISLIFTKKNFLNSERFFLVN